MLYCYSRECTPLHLPIRTRVVMEVGTSLSVVNCMHAPSYRYEFFIATVLIIILHTTPALTLNVRVLYVPLSEVVVHLFAFSHGVCISISFIVVHVSTGHNQSCARPEAFSAGEGVHGPQHWTHPSLSSPARPSLGAPICHCPLIQRRRKA